MAKHSRSKASNANAPRTAAPAKRGAARNLDARRVVAELGRGVPRTKAGARPHELPRTARRADVADEPEKPK